MKLSIIISVYNIENYLIKCLESILFLVNSVEIILVIGDSLDKSNDICYEYQNLYKFIKVISQDGVGLSNARNCGLRKAIGEYILFVDGDDYIVSTALDKTLKFLFKSDLIEIDVVVSDFYLCDEKSELFGVRKQIDKTESFLNYDYTEKIFRSKKSFWNVWRYLFKRQFLVQNEILFMENTLCEDVDFITKVYLCTKKIYYYHNPFYCYRVGRTNSLMNITNLKRITDILDVFKKNITLLDKNRNFEYAELMKNAYMLELFLNIVTIAEVPANNKFEAIGLFKSSINIFKKGNSSVRGFYVIVNLAGLNNIAHILKVLKYIKRKRRHSRKVSFKF